MNKKILHLNLKKVYFDDIKSGNKKFEYRERKDFWKKKLVNKSYDEIHIKMGYPKSTETDKIIIRPWLGFIEETITHPHFGNVPIDVYSIIVN